MSILKRTILLQTLVANELLAINEIGSMESDNKSIEKFGKLLKTKKVSKLRNLKSEILSKSKKPSTLEYVFTLLRLTFTNIWIEIKFQSSLLFRKIISWDTQYKTHDTKLLALFRLQILEAFFFKL